MSIAKMTIIGMEQFLRDQNDSIFKDIILPSGIDKETLVDEILLKCSEFEVYYASSYMMKNATKHFFKKHLNTFEKWVEGEEVTWNPVENYDRWEDWTDKGSDERTGNRKDVSSASDTSTTSGSGETKQNVTTYDSGTYKPDNQTESTSGATSSSSTNGNNESNTTDKGTNESNHSGHIHGNIGTTQGSDMLRGWRDVWNWSIYEAIADLYKDEMTVGVYV